MSTIESVYVVEVPGRMDGIYLFRNLDDAMRFAVAAGAPEAVETPICHKAQADELIAAETED